MLNRLLSRIPGDKSIIKKLDLDKINAANKDDDSDKLVTEKSSPKAN